MQRLHETREDRRWRMRPLHFEQAVRRLGWSSSTTLTGDIRAVGRGYRRGRSH
ncbi:hypothetical protein BKA93DRAFT_807708 [Sparassis latifolia]